MKSLFVLLVVGVMAGTAADALAESSRPSRADADPQLNQRDSRSYDNLVDHDAAFRARRTREECEPIQGDDLRRQCVDSFGARTRSGSNEPSEAAHRR